MLYDWITRRDRRLPKHRFRGARETLALWPDLSPELRFSATYHDAWISYPERLGIELVARTARDGAREHRAQLCRTPPPTATVSRCTDAALPAMFCRVACARRCECDRRLARPVARRCCRATATRAAPLMSGTKGSHLILDCPELRQALQRPYDLLRAYGRPRLHRLPYLDKVLAGSTRYPRRSRRPRPLRAWRSATTSSGRCAASFPASPCTEACRLQLQRHPPAAPQRSGAASPAASRAAISCTGSTAAVPQFCMVGGKWTTFRAFAEQAGRRRAPELHRPRVRADRRPRHRRRRAFRPGSTRPRRHGLAGGAGASPERAAHHAVDLRGQPRGRSARLLPRHMDADAPLVARAARRARRRPRFFSPATRSPCISATCCWRRTPRLDPRRGVRRLVAGASLPCWRASLAGTTAREAPGDRRLHRRASPTITASRRHARTPIAREQRDMRISTKAG